MVPTNSREYWSSVQKILDSRVLDLSRPEEIIGRV